MDGPIYIGWMLDRVIGAVRSPHSIIYVILLRRVDLLLLWRISNGRKIGHTYTLWLPLIHRTLKSKNLRASIRGGQISYIISRHRPIDSRVYIRCDSICPGEAEYDS